MAKFRQDFESLGAFLDHVRDEPIQWDIDWPHHARMDSERAWWGTPTFAEADTLAREGWPKGRAALEAARAEQAAIIKQERIPARWLDVAGAYPDVPAAVAGDPLCMVAIGEDIRAQRPVIDFWVHIGARVNVEPATITARGGAILAWMDALEACDYRVAITLISYARIGGRRQHHLDLRIVAKRADEPLDVDRMAYAMTSAAMLRRHVFAWRETTENTFVDSSYGSSRNLPADQIPPGVIYFPKAEDVAPATAAAAVRDQIAAGGLIET